MGLFRPNCCCAALALVLLCGASPALADDHRLAGRGEDARGGLAALRLSGEAVPLEGALPGLRHVLPEIGAGLADTARDILPNAALRGSSFDVTPPRGDGAPALPGRGIAGRAPLDARDPSRVGSSVASALRGSLETRRLRAAARAALAARRAAALGFLPSVTGTLTANDAPNVLIQPGILRQNSVSVGVEATVPIFTSGVLTNRLQQARALSAAADMNFLAAERKVALEAALAHVDLRLQREVVSALTKHRDALRRVATIAKALFRVGEVSRTDVAIAQANVEALAADRADALRRLADAEAGFASLTGRPAPKRLLLPTKLAGLSMESAIARAVKGSHQLAAQDQGARALAHAALAERGRYGPQVSGYANLSRDLHHSVQTERNTNYAFGVRLTVPLVAPAAVASVTEAKEQAISSRYGVMEAERTLRRRVAGLWNAREAASRRVEALRRQMKQVDVTVTGTLREYQAGFRSITDVLEAQVKRLEGAVALEAAIHEHASASLRLDFATDRAAVGERDADG